MPETKSPHDFMCDGVLRYGVEVGRFVFRNTGKTVYAISDLPHIGASDVLMFYQISKLNYQRLLTMSLPDRIPNPPIPASITEPCRLRFLCGESAYCQRYRFTVFQADSALTEDTARDHPVDQGKKGPGLFRVYREDPPARPLSADRDSEDRKLIKAGKSCSSGQPIEGVYCMKMIPRPEYPRPQMVRDEWLNLNGEWQFEMDHGCSGEARGLVEQTQLSGRILVPFCPESELSGIGYKDFMRCVWYKRTFQLPDSADGKRAILHFGAADYHTKVWVNGKAVGIHDGGYTSFEMDITDALCDGENMLTVCCEDDVRDDMQPNGKQSRLYHSHGCDYTRTTGIWQTVWLEWVNPVYIRRVFVTPDAANGTAHFRI